MTIETLFGFVVATSALAISPGPDNIYVLMQSITNGRNYGLATVAGLISGCLVHTTLVAFGVSAVIKNNDTLFLLLKILGAVYLLYLAYKVYQSDAEVTLITENTPKKSLWQLFKQGVIMNVLNPKVSIFFLAFFPGFLFSETLSTVTQFYVLGLLFMLTSLIIFSAIAVLSGFISEYLKQNKNTGLVLKWLQIVVFVGIAVFIFFQKK
ncbi:MAG: LysE family translocator [Mesoflavibacter sp.]|nr:LysE family translocator [Mesoflavibacter sp.]